MGLLILIGIISFLLLNPLLLIKILIFFTFASGVAEFGKYLPEPYTDFNHFWIAKVGVFGEFLRYKNVFSLVLFSDLEMIASSNNIIFFDPRSFYWQEGIISSYKCDSLNFQLSFTHRCKHDIDNADIVNLYGEVRARVIIWDSIWFRLFTDPIGFNWFGINFYFIPFFRNDFYVLSVDESVWYKVSSNVSYSNDSSYKVDKVVNSLSFGNVFDIEFTKQFGFYAKWYWWFDLLGDNVIWNWNKIESVFREHYWELGFYVRNDGLRLFFFIQNNSVREPAIEPFDQGMINVFHFGLRAIDEKFSF
ncbi:MAG: hypothetical protein ACP5QP_06290 [Brevinematia bacterium]